MLATWAPDFTVIVEMGKAAGIRPVPTGISMISRKVPLGPGIVRDLFPVAELPTMHGEGRMSGTLELPVGSSEHLFFNPFHDAAQQNSDGLQAVQCSGHFNAAVYNCVTERIMEDLAALTEETEV